MSLSVKKDFKFWINIVTLGALALLVAVSWEQVKEAVAKLSDLNLFILALIIPVQLIGYYAVAKLYKSFFASQGDKISLKEMYKLALELNFVNNVFPSGGVSGFSYMSIRMKSMGIPTAKSTLAQLLRFALTFISFLTLLILALLLLSLGSGTSQFIIFIATSIILLTIFGTGIGVFIISKSSRIKSFVTWLPRAINAVVKFLPITKRDKVIDIKKVESTLEDLHDDYKLIRSNSDLIRRLLGWALLINITEVLTVYVVYMALGDLVNPGAVIIAYAVANFAGLVAILPGGVGVYEGLMTATLASAGVPRGLALTATLIYRVVSMALFLPVGYFFYNRALRQDDKLKDKIEDIADEPTSTHAN